MVALRFSIPAVLECCPAHELPAIQQKSENFPILLFSLHFGKKFNFASFLNLNDLTLRKSHRLYPDSSFN